MSGGVEVAASVIAVINLSIKITKLCFDYSVAVKDAKNDIERIRKKVDDIKHILESIEKLLDGPHKAQLSTTHGLFKSLKQCQQQLEQLEEQLELGKTRKAMSRFGVRALKWPFTSKQVENIVSSLEGYERSFTLALQVDQMGLLLDVSQKLDLTALPVVMGASYDSHTENNAQCLPNTRTKLLDEITTWANDKEGKSIFWLSGMAGTGKSTIARTVAGLFADRGQLGASFFFKKGEGERGNASRFFTTIAVELVAHEPSMLPGIRAALDEDSTISQRALKVQFEKLILQPLLGIQQARSQVPTRVVVIDALDECEQEQDIQAILQLLAQTKDIRPLPLRIVVTSRPELSIRFSFRKMPESTHQDLVLHEVPSSTIEHDLKLFLECELGKIQEVRMLPSDWPTTRQIQALVKLAVPLFIYAATVCRYVGTKGGNPQTYLDKVLQYKKATFSQLDQTYLPILDQLLVEQEDNEKEEWLHAFRDVVSSIVVLESPLSIASLARLIQAKEQDIKCRLDSLQSILSIPDSEHVPIQLLHLSFREFLVDPQKKGKSPFWVDEKNIHSKLASRCLDLMSKPGGLCKNICGLPGHGVLRSEIDEGAVTSSLLPALQYACRYWVNHLKQSQQGVVDGDTTHLFLQKHLLSWLEAMSLMRESSRCVHLIGSLQSLVRPSASNVSSFLYDAKQFVLRFQSILADAPLQIYRSALVFAPETSLVRQAFADQLPQRVKMVSMKEMDWGACHSTLKGHSLDVAAVAFSPDGKLVASASEDKTVRLWEVKTGTYRSTLEGHSGSVIAVAFSPDGKLVASASEDNTVRLWEAEKGTYRSTLNGRPDWVTAVAFAPKKKLVAWASTDNTIQLWDVAAKRCSRTLEGNSNYVTAVAFSPDGELVASASKENTVQLWEVETGTCLSMLEDHSGSVRALTFSPDGKLVASASGDSEVRLWKVEIKTCSSTLESHSKKVTAVAFSPNGKLVASASDDSTVRLWKVATGKCSSTLEGHSDEVTAVTFSPDGKQVASASEDGTIRLWSVKMGCCYQTLQSPSHFVTTLDFSSDGQRLETDAGYISIPLSSVIPLLSYQPKQLSNILVQDQWISRNQQRFIWLPSEYRSRSTAVHENIACLGLKSGRVVLLRIC